MNHGSTDLPGLRQSIAATLRAHRAQLGWSQRDLAEQAGLPQAAVARIEGGDYDCRLSWVMAALAAVGARLVVPDAAEPTRMAGEYARDRAGRRLPAHLEPYRLDRPHDWWPGQTQILMWRDTPKWSYRRVLSGTAAVRPATRRSALLTPEGAGPRLPAQRLPAQRSAPC